MSECPESLKLWADPYIKLLRTVAPYYHLFPEPQLQARLRALLQAIDVDPPRKQTAQHLPPHGISPHPTDRVAHSASPVNRLSAPVVPGPLIAAHPTGTSNSSAVELGTPQLSLSRDRHAIPPVSIHVLPSSLRQEPQQTPPAFSPGLSTPTLSAPTANGSVRSPSIGVPAVEPTPSTPIAGPSTVPATESISAPPKRKAKKKKKRLTEDDFILADLADWESAKANKTGQPASPSIASAVSAGKAESTPSVHADPQTPREGSVPGPSGSRTSGTATASAFEHLEAPTSNGATVAPASSTAAPEAAASKQSTPVPAAPAETTSVTATSAAEPAPSIPAVPAAFPPGKPAELDLRAQATSPGSPKSSKKKRPSQELHVVSGNMPPTNMPVKRKKHSPGLMVFRVDPQPTGAQPGLLPTNGSAPEAAIGKEQARQRDGDVPHPGVAGMDVVMEDRDEAPLRESKPAFTNLADPQVVEETSGTLQGQESRQENAGQVQSTSSSSATASLPEHASEDVVMDDLVHSPEVDQAGWNAEPMELDSSPAVEVPAGTTEEVAMDIVREPAPSQSNDSQPWATSTGGSSPPPTDKPRVGVVSSEGPARAAGHPQLEGAVAYKAEGTSMDVDTQPAATTLQFTMSSNSTEPSPSTDRPYEGVIRELADKKGMSGNIALRIVDAVAEEPQLEANNFHLAPAEWSTETRSSSPSDSNDELSAPSLEEPVVPRKRSRSQLQQPEGVDQDVSRKRRTESPSPTPAPTTATVDHPVPAAPSTEQLLEEPAPTADQPIPQQVPTVQQPLPGPTEDHPVVEQGVAAAVLADADTKQDAPFADKAGEQTTELQFRVPDDAEVQAPQQQDIDKEEGEADESEEPPVTLANIPPEEGEIRMPTPTPPPATAQPIPIPPVDLNSPLAYSELRVLDCRRGSDENEVVSSSTSTLS
ncbi:uncharacterized protein B0H18DRAFT_256992 [Fomitopsis serialis]|uniref:uncharacterized protein n=1 Tax=Fomitopsis serialis TaxID=139415 RepID=UPI0020088667|nr:uncharacterized protein B0H18DRAFT_256992 [Neoantrodia serialis]KAH9928394.1 hypothetical protein B0H18DRAFT_256992 [Neoantrodia serialis]